MLFNSVEFLIFLPLVFLLYWYGFQRNLRLQNLFIVVVSYLFYGWWDWTFLLLIFFGAQKTAKILDQYFIHNRPAYARSEID